MKTMKLSATSQKNQDAIDLHWEHYYLYNPRRLQALQPLQLTTAPIWNSKVAQPLVVTSHPLGLPK